MKKYCVTALICLVLVASVAYGVIIRVSGDHPITIQEAIDAAVDGDIVLVPDGTWTGEGNKNLDFKGKAITVTSENGPENCIIDCEGDGVGFIFQSGEGESSVVSGFTITNGYTPGGGCLICHGMPEEDADTDVVAGGGIFCLNSSPTITQNIIKDNKSYEGGGIYCGNSSPTITNNIIEGNSTGTLGGGIFCFDASPEIINNAIFDNSAADHGGGICCFDHVVPSSYKIINNTIFGNLAYDGGGIYCLGFDSYLIITNTILWNNSPDEIVYEGGGSITVTYSDIQGGWEGEGNIDADPMFVDPENGDFHLQADSPCIDRGTPDGAPPDDIEGNPRDEFPDIGAYEYQVGTGSINGTVTDRAGNPIKRALVIAALGETKEKDFTDSEGYYEILALEPGTYWVLCIKKDYKLGIRKAEVVAGEETTVNFRLKEKPE